MREIESCFPQGFLLLMSNHDPVNKIGYKTEKWVWEAYSFKKIRITNDSISKYLANLIRHLFLFNKCLHVLSIFMTIGKTYSTKLY